MSTMPLRALLDTTDPYNLWCHRTRNQPWEDTTMPIAMIRDNCRPSADHHWRPTVRHTSDSRASHAARTRVSAPRAHPVDWLGIVALVCGVVTVIALLVLAVLAVGRR